MSEQWADKITKVSTTWTRKLVLVIWLGNYDWMLKPAINSNMVKRLQSELVRRHERARMHHSVWKTSAPQEEVMATGWKTDEGRIEDQQKSLRHSVSECCWQSYLGYHHENSLTWTNEERAVNMERNRGMKIGKEKEKSHTKQETENPAVVKHKLRSSVEVGKGNVWGVYCSL